MIDSAELRENLSRHVTYISKQRHALIVETATRV